MAVKVCDSYFGLDDFGVVCGCWRDLYGRFGMSASVMKVAARLSTTRVLPKDIL